MREDPRYEPAIEAARLLARYGVTELVASPRLHGELLSLCGVNDDSDGELYISGILVRREPPASNLLEPLGAQSVVGSEASP